jgi:hypothetical protein
MAYQLDRFNGTFLVQVDDQTINSTATDLRFVGRNYSGYGEIENENLLHLLENFANSSAPPRAISGQTWFDTSTKKLKIYDGNKFKVTTGAESSANAPTGLAVGDFWWDNQNEQIKVWNGNEFILVGPEKSPIFGATSTAPAVVKDSVGTDQQIIKFQVGGEVIAIVSRSTFNLSTVINPIPGFGLLKPGINFINSDPTTGETSSVHRFNGTASNAERLGGFTVDSFLRSGNTNFVSQVSFRDNGFTVGDQNDFKLTLLNGSTPTLESTLNNPFIFRISNGAGDIKDVAVIKPTGIDPGSTGIYDLGANSAKWKTVNAVEVKATTFYGKLIGSVETAPDSSGVVPPLAIQSIAVSGNFNMSASGGGAGASNFSVNLAGSTSAVNLSSGTVGSLNNFNIGSGTPGTAAFTTLASSGTVTFTNTSASTGVGTGALVVAGGASIGGTVYVQGNGIFVGTGAIKVPSGTTGGRPTVPQQGMIRFNTTDGEWEGYDGVQWRFIGGDADEDYGSITSTSDVFVDYGTLI